MKIVLTIDVDVPTLEESKWELYGPAETVPENFAEGLVEDWVKEIELACKEGRSPDLVWFNEPGVRARVELVRSEQ